jgi:hypothetical protein
MSEEDAMNRQLNTHRPWRSTHRPPRRAATLMRFDERRTLSAVFGESTVRQWRGW